MSLQTYHLRNLFGGAIVAEIRSNWMDTSEYRQVPDDQEVFQDPESHLSMQIDLCQRVEDAGGEDDVFRFHAENLIEEGGDMRLSSITQVSLAKFPENIPARMALAGTVPTRKNLYQGILLLVVRLEAVTTDIVVSINLPDMDENREGVGEEGAAGSRYQEALDMMQRVVQTLEVKDYGLFKA